MNKMLRWKLLNLKVRVNILLLNISVINKKGFFLIVFIYFQHFLLIIPPLYGNKLNAVFFLTNFVSEEDVADRCIKTPCIPSLGMSTYFNYYAYVSIERIKIIIIDNLNKSEL